MSVLRDKSETARARAGRFRFIAKYAHGTCETSLIVLSARP